MSIRNVMQAAAPVMPVLVIDDEKHAVDLGRALLAGGMRVAEITLRTPGAIAAIRAMREELPELTVGAGTVLTPELMLAVKEAGGQFAVSPGFTPILAEAALEYQMPLLPGVVTAGEIQSAMEHGYRDLKFFPAGAAGGAALLGNYAGVFPDVRFCPTGGIKLKNMNDYLALPNVLCVGGSWVAPRDLVAAGDWQSITRLVAAAQGRQ
ncbi:MAG: bifunctional 4-hydroxy-2-oxoglutarate aldolase/2-dehydro-3-deoxy-phosphogluconate aldolase [Gammaproteobacteria bacterium]|nr:bifunctional 4-hydroxy-2-oxoglutarate aldolase/2-dehydro-3-deoxy-phosphogluconate aldolase [Gammaproteobacteria bacterium]NNF67371.1 bifunctional 4-hydroxy-2-oxoglutarate aldolase/2-dehydro-3-deoxy-phosphogluconate aldolase [Gammaproteobacteria bacterium]